VSMIVKCICCDQPVANQYAPTALCERCKEPCEVCNGPVQNCQHPLSEQLTQTVSNPFGNSFERKVA
jgi:hypothetical protein